MKSKTGRRWLVWLIIVIPGLNACGSTLTPTTIPAMVGAISSPTAPPTLPLTLPTSPTPLTTINISPNSTPTSTPSRPSSQNHLLETVWRTGDDQDRLRDLSGLTTDSSGNLYLADSWRQIVRKYDPTGRLLFELTGKLGEAFDHPQILTLDIQNNLYVVSGGESKISKFDATGHFLFSFHWQPPNSPGPFSGVSGLVVDEHGFIYALDSVGRVYVYDVTGAYLKTWGNPVGRDNPDDNTGPGQLKYPAGLATDWHGHIYVGNPGNHRIEKFSLSGQFLFGWGKAGAGKGQFGKYMGENGLATDKAGNLYVADVANYRVQKFDAYGNFLDSWGSGPGNADGQFKGPQAVAVDPQGNLYATDPGNERVQKFDQAHHLLARIGRQNLGEGELTYPTSIATNGKTALYVVDSTTRYIQKYDLAGHFVQQWLVPTLGPVDPNTDGKLSLGLDHTGRLYVADGADNFIKKYDDTGHLLLSWGGPGQNEGQFNRPGSPFVDELDNIYFADVGNSRLQKFDGQGNFLFKLDFHNETNARGETVNMFPTAVALDRQNHIYVALPGCSCVQKFDGGGRLLLEWGRPDPQSFINEDGHFIFPNSLAVDSVGNLYVMDLGNLHCTNCRIQKFDQQGYLLAVWHSQFNASPMFPPLVIGNGQFASITAMTVDQEGNLYVGEPGYGRLQKLRQLN